MRIRQVLIYEPLRTYRPIPKADSPIHVWVDGARQQSERAIGRQNEYFNCLMADRICNRLIVDAPEW